MKSTSKLISSIALLLGLIHIIIHIAFFEPAISPALGITILASLGALAVILKQKDNIWVTIGSYVLIIGALLAILMITMGKGTGNLEGWEFLFGEGVMLVAEIVAIVSYLIGLLRK